MKRNPYRYYSLFAWLGLFMIPATVLFWGILGENIPPYSASLSADEFAAEIIANASKIRIGMIGQLWISFIYALWGFVISKVMEEVEVDNNLLSTVQRWGTGLTTLIFMLPCVIWLTVVYRPEQMDPKTLQIFYDFGWLFFDNTFTLTSMAMITMGVCFLQDERPEPLIPAWVCWLAICSGISFVMEIFMPLFKSGAFSRSGLINYWIEFSLFFIYWWATAIYLIKAINRLKREHANAA